MNTRKLRALPYLLLLLPFDLAVAVVFLFVEAISVPVRLFKKPPNSHPPLEHPSATIQILNWDGKHLLEESIPHVLEAVRRDGGDHEVAVVDNGSRDGSADFVRQNYPQIRLVALDRNYRFTGGNNRGVWTSEKEIVVFLNNDMIVEPDFLRPLLDGFKDPSVFAVSSQVFFWDKTRRREETGKTRARFIRGFFEMWHEQISTAEEKVATIPVFWGGGGSCAWDRRKYLEIGGLDTLYDPFYLEDTDLSYQAWKRGWKSVLAPSSHVIHKHRATNRPKFGNQFVDNTIRKNQYLFVWKNVTDSRMFFEHLLNLPRTHGRLMVAGDAWFEVGAFLRALRQLPEAAWKRLRPISRYTESDAAVLMQSAAPAVTGQLTDIDFSRRDFGEALGSGWYGLEDGFRWMGREASCALYSERPVSELLVETVLPQQPPKLSIEVNGKTVLSEKPATPGPHAFRAKVQAAGIINITIRLSRTFLPGNADVRELGAIVKRICVS